MFKTYRVPALFYTVFFSLFISQSTLAEDRSFGTSGTETTGVARSLNKGGFVYDIQKLDPLLLAENVTRVRNDLLQRQFEMEQQVESKKLDAGDALITIILPGGLFYAGYRKLELEKAKKVLLTISSDIKELSNDLTALYMQDKFQPVLLAQRP